MRRTHPLLLALKMEEEVCEPGNVGRPLEMEKSEMELPERNMADL